MNIYPEELLDSFHHKGRKEVYTDENTTTISNTFDGVYFYDNEDELSGAKNVNTGVVDDKQKQQRLKSNERNNHKKHIYSSSDDINRLEPIRKSFSCTSCVLCSNNTDVKRTKDGGFPLRKAASCSICTWDLEEFEIAFEEEIENSEDERKHRGENKKSDEEENNDDSHCSRKRSNSYTKAMEDDISLIDKNSTDAIKLNNSDKRLPPDGGELEEEVEEYSYLKQSSSSISSYSERRKNLKSQSSSERKITEELDEIFGKLDSNERHSKKRRSFKKLVRTPSFLKRKKTRSKFETISKSRSEERLYSEEPDLHYIPKSVSTMDISYHEIDDYEEEENELHVNEAYITYLTNIGGMSIFGGNDKLRFIWHQISTYQNDLMDLFDDFLRAVIDEVQLAYKKCQDLEFTISMKMQQQEKEMTKIYDDTEIALRQEREQLQEKHIEKEENLKNDFLRQIKSKEQDVVELYKTNVALKKKDEEIREENQHLKNLIEKLEAQNKMMTTNEESLLERNTNLENENKTLKEKLRLQEDTMEHSRLQLLQATTIATETQDNYNRLLRRLKNLTEEKEHLEESCSNLTADLEDLRANNNRNIMRRYSWSTTSSLDFERASSPIIQNEDETSNCYSITPDSTSYNKATESVIISTKYTQRWKRSITVDDRNRYIQTPSGFTAIKSMETGTFHNNNINDYNDSFVKNIVTPAMSSLKILTHSTPKRRIKYDNQESTPIRLASSKNTSEFKVIFTGDVNVGKTSLIRRLCQGRFKANREVTAEIDCSTKIVDCSQKSVTLKLWDTVGTEKFNSIPPSYFRKSDVVVLMYDITDEGTFLNAKKWLRQIHNYTNENIFLILLGSKADLYHIRTVAPKRAESLAVENDAMFIETSSKSGENTESLCQMIASTLLERDDTVFIRNDFESSLCSLSYSMKRSGDVSICCN